MYGWSNPFMSSFNPFSFGGGYGGGYSGFGGGFGGFNFGGWGQPAPNPRAAPSPYSFTPWGSGYFNDAARSGATGQSSPYMYSSYGMGPMSGFGGFGGGFGGFNPYANPMSFMARPNAIPYRGAAPMPTQQPVKSVDPSLMAQM